MVLNLIYMVLSPLSSLRFLIWIVLSSIYIEDAELVCDDFQLTILVNQPQCNKWRNYGLSVVKFHLIYAIYFSKIISPKWYSWRVVQWFNCDRHLTIILQLIFISGSIFNSGVLLVPLRDDIQNASLTYCKRQVQTDFLSAVMVNFRSRLKQ